MPYEVPQTLAISLINVQDTALTGTVSFHVPEGWSVSPDCASFSLLPGEQQSVSCTLTVPRMSKRPCRSWLDLHFQACGTRWRTSAGIVLPYTWRFLPMEPMGDCPGAAAFTSADVLDMNSNVLTLSDRKGYYAADVKAPVSMTVRMLAQGTVPVRVWLNGALVSDHEDTHSVPAFHRNANVAIVTLQSGWNRLMLEHRTGSAGTCFLGFAGVTSWQWINTLEWR